MNHRHSHEGDSEALAFPEVRTSLPMVRRSRDPVILVFSQRPAARCAADAMEPDEGFEPLGSIAVRLVARWALPRIRLLGSPRGNGDPSA